MKLSTLSLYQQVMMMKNCFYEVIDKQKRAKPYFQLGPLPEAFAIGNY